MTIINQSRALEEEEIEGITVGAIRIIRDCGSGNLWVINVLSGEAMLTPPDRLEKHLLRFWRRHF